MSLNNELNSNILKTNVNVTIQESNVIEINMYLIFTPHSSQSSFHMNHELQCYSKILLRI